MHGKPKHVRLSVNDFLLLCLIFNNATSSQDLFLDCICVFDLDVFLDNAWVVRCNAVNDLLSFHQVQTCSFLNSLDDSDLLLANFLQ